MRSQVATHASVEFGDCDFLEVATFESSSKSGFEVVYPDRRS